jgi:hypothetical protein
MSNRTLAIVFRNAHPQRTPVRSELYLLRGNACARHHSEEVTFADPVHLHSMRAVNNPSLNPFTKI